MGCDYSTNLNRDIVVKEGRLFKFCKIALNPAYSVQQTRKRMNLIESDVGGHKTAIMVWEKQLSENTTDVHFLKSFYSEADAVVIEINMSAAIETANLQRVKSEISRAQIDNSKEQIPVFVFAKANKVYGQALSAQDQQSNSAFIMKFSTESGWRIMNLTAEEREDARFQFIANEIYKLGIHPRKLNKGTLDTL